LRVGAGCSLVGLITFGIALLPGAQTSVVGAVLALSAAAQDVLWSLLNGLKAMATGARPRVSGAGPRALRLSQV
jgi:hypothetical protein